MIIKINGLVTNAVAGASVKDTVRDWTINTLGNSLGGWLADRLTHLFQYIDSYSPEIFTFLIVICALGVMIAPLIGSSSHKWFGRMAATLMAGILWRLML